jgi:hypothetical protein
VKLKLNCGLIIALWFGASLAWADSLELKNGSLIKGKFMGGTESEISFQVGSSVQKYNLADIVSLKFDSERATSDQLTPSTSSLPSEPQPADHAGMKAMAYVTIPAGTRVSVRTIDAIDSTQNQVGDRFQASLEEPLRLDGNEIVSRDAGVYGRLEESKESGTFTGRSQLRLELTALVVNGRTVPIVTGEYELTGKSRGTNRPGEGAVRDPDRVHPAAGCIDTDPSELVLARVTRAAQSNHAASALVQRPHEDSPAQSQDHRVRTF